MPEIDLAGIELLVLDVDGVMTDGAVTLTPGGEEIKSFHVRDGAGMKCWQADGRRIAVISGRSSPAVLKRCQELGVDSVRLGASAKLPVYRQLLSELGVAPQAVAVVGDDLPDLPLLMRCGLPVAVADAAEEVRQAAAYVTRLPGGKGCVREVVEMILRGSGRWQAVLDRYVLPAEDES